MWIYLNDRFVKEGEAVVSVFDHGFLYGDGVYETIRSYGSRIFMRDLHLARLHRSADAIGLTIPIAGHRWPLRFVGRKLRVAQRRALFIECHNEAVRLPFTNYLQQRRRKAEQDADPA